MLIIITYKTFIKLINIIYKTFINIKIIITY